MVWSASTKIISDPTDLLSSLSDDLLIKILSLTKSYKSAVLCSALSKRWGDLYRLLPCLYFDEEDYSETNSHDDDDGDERQKRNQDVLISTNLAIAITRHRRKIHTLFFEGTHSRCHIWEWCLGYLIPRNHIRHLSLSLTDNDNDDDDKWERFPVSILQCCSLVTLALDFLYEISHPFPRFPNLRHCELSLAIQRPDDVVNFHSLLPSCPALQDLKMNMKFLGKEQQVPLLFSSTTLLQLDVHLELSLEAENPLQIRVETPELLLLIFDTYDEVEAHVEAPKLLEICILPTTAFVLDISQFPKRIKGFLKAKWSKNDHVMSSLELANYAEADRISTLSMISHFKALQFLELSGICACPNDFWRMLTKLHLLEKLVLTYCYYIEEDDRTDYLDEKHCSMPKLTEVYMSNKCEDCFDGERKMLSILLKIRPNLRILHFVLNKYKLKCKAKYAAMIWQLLSPGEYLNLQESSHKLEFTISRN